MPSDPPYIVLMFVRTGTWRRWMIWGFSPTKDLIHSPNSKRKTRYSLSTPTKRLANHFHILRFPEISC